MSNLEADTRLDARPNGRYVLDLGDRWSFLAPSGGVLLGVAIRAMAAELAEPSQRVMSATAVFCEPIREGRLSAEVRILRRGGAASQLRAVLTNGDDPRADRPGMEVVATFGRSRPGPEVTGRRPPDVPPPEASRPSPTSRYEMKFFENFEDRIALGHLWNETDWSAGEAHFARWLRYRDPPRDADGALEAYALGGIADLMPPSLLQALGPDQTRFMAPSLDLTMHFFERTKKDWILVYGRCQRAHDGVASCSVELWDDDGHFLAFATQVMMLRRWPRRSEGAASE